MAECRLATESSASWETVRSADNYRAFLRAYLEERGLSLSDLARAAGFGRGFPGDVISGKRRLTAQSCFAFEKAMKLPPAGRKLFRLLVARDERDVFPELEHNKILQSIESLRAKPWNRSRRDVRDSDAPISRQALQNPSAIAVFAAAGKPESGATLSELRVRTRLSEPELLKAIESLVIAGLLVVEGESYKPTDLHLFFKAGDQKEAFKALFTRATEKSARRAKENVGSDSEMFFTSTFCVEEDRLPALKRALRETILKFVDDSIHPEGDRIVHLLTSLHL
jgi:transcriptional regulator with XRE-family HTH domain